jgi:hypothetical protein
MQCSGYGRRSSACAVREDSGERPDGVLERSRYATQVTQGSVGLPGMGRDIGSLKNSGDALSKDYEILEPATERVLCYVVNIGLSSWVSW